jgi:hypothetical protein|tara:strand:- start:102 stop:416 length:315 start_codon:yes stop_codon:yes gene_type:complete
MEYHDKRTIKGENMSSNQNDKLLTTEEHLSNYVKEFAAIEDAMEPFKEQRRDLRESYDTNGWLSKEEMRLAVKAYRLVKSDTDMEQLTEYFNKLKRTVRSINHV